MNKQIQDINLYIYICAREQKKKKKDEEDKAVAFENFGGRVQRRENCARCKIQSRDAKEGSSRDPDPGENCADVFKSCGRESLAAFSNFRERFIARLKRNSFSFFSSDI